MQRAKSRTYPSWVEKVLDRPIVLVGLMGAGKSSIGRLLAARLGLEFVDADAEIESAAGATIEEIFETHGEAFFRSGERRVIDRLLAGPVRVIATGGGAFIDDDTRRKIKAAGLSIWLKADTETLLKRVSRRGGRPLLKGGDPRQVMSELMAGRNPFYAEADITVETSENPPTEVTDRVIAAVAAHFGVEPPARPRRGKANGTGKAKQPGGAARNAKAKSAPNGHSRRRRRAPRAAPDSAARTPDR
jgi:shikimate kinase